MGYFNVVVEPLSKKQDYILLRWLSKAENYQFFSNYGWIVRFNSHFIACKLYQFGYCHAINHCQRVGVLKVVGASKGTIVIQFILSVPILLAHEKTQR
jgi:putative ABC transport system permease protein